MFLRPACQKCSSTPRSSPTSTAVAAGQSVAREAIGVSTGPDRTLTLASRVTFSEWPEITHSRPHDNRTESGASAAFGDAR